MRAKSEFVSSKAWGKIPRWVFEVWLWASVAAVGLESYGCPDERLSQNCTRFSNTIGAAFDLFPGTLVMAFLTADDSLPIALGCIALCAAGCHIVMRKILPERLSWRRAAVFVVAWVAVSLVTEFLSILLFFAWPSLARSISRVFIG